MSKKKTLDFVSGRLTKTWDDVADKIYDYIMKPHFESLLARKLADYFVFLAGSNLTEEEFADVMFDFLPFHLLFDCEVLIDGVSQRVLDHFLQTKGAKLGAYERHVLQKVDESHYRFYQTLKIEADGLHVRELFEGKELFINLPHGTEDYPIDIGAIVCLRLIEDQQKCILAFQLPFILQADRAPMIVETGVWLKHPDHFVHKGYMSENETIIYEYWRMIRGGEDVQNEEFDDGYGSYPPDGVNEDGDYIEPNQLVYTTALPLETVLGKLLSLTDCLNVEELMLLYSVRNEAGELTGVDFPRFDEYGTRTAFFKVRAGEIRIQTNSAKRSGRMKSSLTRRFGKDIKLFDQIWIPVKELQTAKAMVLDEGTQQLMENFFKQYFVEWLDQPLLGGKTPRELSRSKEGREFLEMAMRQFENKNEMTEDTEFKIDVDWLRAQLNLR